MQGRVGVGGGIRGANWINVRARNSFLLDPTLGPKSSPSRHRHNSSSSAISSRSKGSAGSNSTFLAALVLQFPIKHPPLTGHLPALNTVEKAAAAAVGSAISGSDRPIRDKSSCGARRYGGLVRSVPFNFDFGIKQAPSTNRMPMSLYVRIADPANKLR